MTITTWVLIAYFIQGPVSAEFTTLAACEAALARSRDLKSEFRQRVFQDGFCIQK